MSEKEKNDFMKMLEDEDNHEFNFAWVAILICIFGLGFRNNENPRIIELEKKVAKLEGQMSMIGGKTL